MFEAERGEKNVRRRVPLTAARRSGQCSSNLPRTHDFYPRVGRRRNAEKRVSDAALQREKQITSMNQIEAERKIRQISSIGQIFAPEITRTISYIRASAARKPPSPPPRRKTNAVSVHRKKRRRNEFRAPNN